MNNPIVKFLKEDWSKIHIGVCGDSFLDERYDLKIRRTVAGEFPAPVFFNEEEEPSETILGGSGNTISHFKNFEVKQTLITFLDSVAKTKYANKNFSIIDLPKISDKIHTPRKKRFYCDGQAVFRWDVEKPNYGLSNKDLAKYGNELFLNSRYEVSKMDVLIISDYNKGVLNSHLSTSLVRNSKCSIVDSKSKNLNKYRNCTVFKINEAEANDLVETPHLQIRDEDQIDDLEALHKETMKRQCIELQKTLNCKYVILTRAEKGAFGYDGNDFFEVSAPFVSCEIKCRQGAGDCFSAFLGMALAKNFSIKDSAEIACNAATLYVHNVCCEPVSREQLESLVKDRVVFTNGCFDILHHKHIELLEFAKKQGDKLIVAVNSDASVKRLKGNSRPINTLADRMKILSSLSCVDEVVSFEEDTPIELIRKIKPQIIVKGGNYSVDEVVGSNEPFIEKVELFPYKNGVSTTKIIEKCRENNLCRV
jgi:D-beta-D-heptose 7-phosphate kinase/D-beta-D-heptose 1-phosphate adenosyltransferase